MFSGNRSHSEMIGRSITFFSMDRWTSPSVAATRFQRLAWRDPYEAVYAVGDVHGCLVQLRALDGVIAEDARQYRSSATILLGDVVDRGPSSAQTLDHLIEAAFLRPDRFCLVGNHEAMMLDFLRSPSPRSRWLDFGGLETLASYGISSAEIEGKSASALRPILESHLPPEHIQFLGGLPVMISTPTHVFVHAGIRPGNSLEAQTDDDLLWFRDGFENLYETSDRVVVHGHVPLAEPMIRGNRIAVDTGAYLTGRLSAVCVRAGREPYILSVGDAADGAPLSPGR